MLLFPVGSLTSTKGGRCTGNHVRQLVQLMFVFGELETEQTEGGTTHKFHSLHLKRRSNCDFCVTLLCVGFVVIEVCVYCGRAVWVLTWAGWQCVGLSSEENTWMVLQSGRNRLMGEDSQSTVGRATVSPEGSFSAFI